MPFRGVFFDIDGTLVGLRPPPEVLYREICREQGLGCPEALLSRARRVALAFVRDHGLEYLDDEGGMWREANRRVFAHLGVGEQAGACAALFQVRFRQRTEEFLLPDALATLEGLRDRGYLLGALTGRLHSSEELLVQLGVRPLFAFYLYAGEVGVHKPDRRMYQAALERVGLPAAAVVLVGDDASDVEGARSVGMTPVVIARDGRVRAEDVRHLADLGDLLLWLDKEQGGSCSLG